MKSGEIITFKVDEVLHEMIKNIPNRSQFIRNAILNALGNTCPLCNGTGILSPKQLEHWNSFTQSHEIKRCEKCHEKVLVCVARDRETDELAPCKTDT